MVDNYSNSSPESIKRVEQITGKSVKTYKGDVKNHAIVRQVLKGNKIDCIIHFAGLKAVGESVVKLVLYYRNNIDITLTLLECMEEIGVENIIFSSSATVYGEENSVPYSEEMKKEVAPTHMGGLYL